ncbi:MAG: ribonuclease HII [Bacteroidales bacterium]|jgi:ribonuclease HII|nr:ribonuclease HII [Bacteroidales bacterium]MDD2686922.1 ribonuclease HII [Bacteroidales bacterium]MDD3330049.1 ribonuclease HII [Bacteroidales bacterium]MDD3690855.1 ribonuclease HII [Bacteroidales bacterium]MDD4044143.1 ribonuclease HII [Bacteroidales bacterium]
MLKSSYQEYYIEAGCDEAGRGCLAGPVFAAAVIFSKNFTNNSINDSKKLNKKQRDELRIVIENESIAWAVSKVDANEIDEINILQASFKAMNLAINKLKIIPDLLLIDGNRFNTNLKIPYVCVIKGDTKYLSIAAASILAKTYRDEYMENLHLQYPSYAWNKNKGYPSNEHRNAIIHHGITPYHRKSFSLIPQQLKLKFS